MEDVIGKLSERYDRKKWINSYVSKGPIIIHAGKYGPLIAVDKKTEDHHLQN